MICQIFKTHMEIGICLKNPVGWCGYIVPPFNHLVTPHIYPVLTPRLKQLHDVLIQSKRNV